MTRRNKSSGTVLQNTYSSSVEHSSARAGFQRSLLHGDDEAEATRGFVVKGEADDENELLAGDKDNEDTHIEIAGEIR